MRLKKQIERDLNLSVKIRIGTLGSLNVLVDGETIYSNRHPQGLLTIPQIIQRIQSKAQSA